MCNCVKSLAISLPILIIASACNRDVAGGNPKMPLSNRSGTSRDFSASEAQVMRAITTAFSDFRYRSTFLEPAVECRYLVTGWHPTNGFVLFPLDGAISNVPLDSSGNKSVPYIPYFHIIVTSVKSNETRLTVRTIRAEVIDGKELFNVHGGEALHHRKVPPVAQEETNVILEVEKALKQP
jgi:hypothetical protein